MSHLLTGSLSVHKYSSVNMHSNVSVFVSVSVRVRVHVSVCTYAHMHSAYIRCMYVCMHRRVSVHVHMSN